MIGYGFDLWNAARGGGGVAGPAKPTITAPSASANVEDGVSTTYTVTGDTYDSVEFFIGGTSIGTVTGNSGSLTLDVGALGLLYSQGQSLTAVGTIGAETSPTSDAVTITVAPPGIGASLAGWYYAGNWDTVSGEITQWHDASTELRHATQGTGSQQPTATTHGGVQCARFVAANNDHLIADAQSGVVNGTDEPYTVMFMAQRVSGKGTVFGWGSTTDIDVNVQMQWPKIATGTNRFLLYRRDDAANIVNSETADGVADTGTWHVYTVIWTGTTHILREDGVNISLTHSPDQNTELITADRFTIGGLRLTTGFGFANPSDVRINAFLMWGEELSTADRDAAEAEMQSRIP